MSSCMSANGRHWRTLAFIAALRVDRIDAPCVFDGPMIADSFLAYVEQVLSPTLRAGDIVVSTISGATRGRPSTRPSLPQAPDLSSCPPASLLPRPQSHRTDLRQAQNCPTQGASAHHRRGHARDRAHPAILLSRGMRQSLQTRRICFNLKGSCSSAVCQGRPRLPLSRFVLTSDRSP